MNYKLLLILTIVIFLGLYIFNNNINHIERKMFKCNKKHKKQHKQKKEIIEDYESYMSVLNNSTIINDDTLSMIKN